MSNYTYKNIGMGPINYGIDHNFFDKIAVSSSSFNTNADAFIPFVTQGVMFLNLGSGGTNTVEFSFNGTTVHGELNPANASVGLTFNNRVIGKIWFRLASGSTGPVTVSVNAWAVR